jgi:tRNA1Val (adenine37-N6)-methyltransferase
LQRRELFPRGLFQPAGGFRFGADTLLLAAFAARNLPTTRPGATQAGLELGVGCGAACLGLLLLRPERNLRLTGIDLGPDMVAAANQNAEALGLTEHFHAEQADAQDYQGPAGGSGRGFHFALSNPPFRLPGTGRTAATAQKDRARFEGPGGLSAFVRCAARCLRPGGRFYLLHLAERLPELLRTLQDADLAPELLLPVQGAAEKPTRLVLLAARKGGRGGLTLAPPLLLYDAQRSLTAQAQDFCPHLGVNARPSAAMSVEADKSRARQCGTLAKANIAE